MLLLAMILMGAAPYPVPIIIPMPVYPVPIIIDPMPLYPVPSIVDNMPVYPVSRETAPCR